MKYYVMIDGKLVEATLDQIMNPEIRLFDAEGKEVKRAEADVVPPADPPDVPPVKAEGDSDVEPFASAIEELTGVVADVLEKVKVVEDKATKAEAAGFVLPGDTTFSQGADDDNDVMAYVGKRYNLSRQGQNLKAQYPNWKPSEESMKELSKYWLLIASMSAKRPDPKAFELFEKEYGLLKTPIGDSGNAFPIPDIVDAEILAFAREASVVLAQGRVVDMTSEKQSYPQETSSASVSWGNTTSQSDPGISEVQLDAEELSCYSVVKNMTLADALSDIVSWLTANLGEAAGLELDNKAFNGLGTDDPFICSGILSAACGYSVTMAGGSTAFSQLTATHLSAMIAELDGLKKQNAKFWMHGSSLHFVRDLKDDNNRPIFYETVGSPQSGQILGFPYKEVIKAPSTSGSSTAMLAFGNLKYFLVGRRLGASALDINPYLLWTTNRTAFKLYQRWGMAMGLPEGFVRLLTAAS